MNTLYYGDNLNILRRYVKDETVDLVYLDPPFNSNRNYNVLFKDESGVEADSQITAFEDTWHPRGSGENISRTHSRRRQGFRNAPSLLRFHRQQPDDGLSRNDGRPPKGTPPRPQTDRQPLSPLRSDRLALIRALLWNVQKWFSFIRDIRLLSGMIRDNTRNMGNERNDSAQS